jgi:hypothetical protein
MRLRFAFALLAVAAAAAAVLVSIFLVHDALADGDPASDYLISQPLFVTFKANLSGGDSTRLRALLDDAKAKGFPLKVAVIAGPYDLGSVPSLFAQPQKYADFLGQEDYYFFKAPLLVVMPQGYGLYNHGRPVHPADRAVIAKLPPPRTAVAAPLIARAERAVTALAARRGITLEAASKKKGHSPWRDRLVIVAGVLVLAAIAVVVRMVVRRR